jgi:hypothetical protein
MWAMERDDEATAFGVGTAARRACGTKRVANWRIVEEKNIAG